MALTSKSGPSAGSCIARNERRACHGRTARLYSTQQQHATGDLKGSGGKDRGPTEERLRQERQGDDRASV